MPGISSKELEPLLEAIGKAQKAFAIGAYQLQTIMNHIAKTIKPVIESWPWDEIEKAAKILILFIEKCPEELRKAQNKLLDRGWYLYMSDDNDIDDLLIINQLTDEEIEDKMIEHARNSISPVLDKLKSEFPQRYLILKDAFEAHANGLYNLSIPVMLAQADGLSEDFFGVKFFSKKKLKGKQEEPRTKEARKGKLEDDDPFLYAAYISPLDIVSSLQYDMDDRDEMINNGIYYGTLNRHAVLHGEDKDYGTEINSLKCILLLDYLININTLKKNIERKNPKESA